MVNILLDKECEITPFKKVSFMKDVKEVNYVGTWERSILEDGIASTQTTG